MPIGVPIDYSEWPGLSSVTIADEATRQAVLSCLWTAFALRVDENDYLREAAAACAYTAALQLDDRGGADVEESSFGEVLSDVLDLATSVEEVRSAPAGAMVELSLSREEWAQGIEQVRESIEGWPELAAQPADRREKILAVRDAAAERLLSELNLPGAVA